MEAISKMIEDTVVDYLKKNSLTLTTVESCTGGMIASTIVNVPGSSEIFKEGYITYSEEAKCKLVGVNPDTISKYGVVSEQVASEMAMCGLKCSGADCALSVTGVAGPGGGTAETPVGTVYICCAIHQKYETNRFDFSGDRLSVRRQAVTAALNMIRNRFEK